VPGAFTAGLGGLGSVLGLGSSIASGNPVGAIQSIPGLVSGFMGAASQGFLGPGLASWASTMAPTGLGAAAGGVGAGMGGAAAGGMMGGMAGGAAAAGASAVVQLGIMLAEMESERRRQPTKTDIFDWQRHGATLQALNQLSGQLTQEGIPLEAQVRFFESLGMGDPSRQAYQDKLGGLAGKGVTTAANKAMYDMMMGGMHKDEWQEEVQRPFSQNILSMADRLYQESPEDFARLFGNVTAPGEFYGTGGGMYRHLGLLGGDDPQKGQLELQSLLASAMSGVAPTLPSDLSTAQFSPSDYDRMFMDPSGWAQVGGTGEAYQIQQHAADPQAVSQMMAASGLPQWAQQQKMNQLYGASLVPEHLKPEAVRTSNIMAEMAATADPRGVAMPAPNIYEGTDLDALAGLPDWQQQFWQDVGWGTPASVDRAEQDRLRDQIGHMLQGGTF
jgi:hypothetical protein